MNPGIRILLNLVLLASLAGITAASWMLRSEVSNTNYEFLPDMVHSPRYNAYSMNTNFADGKSLQQPPVGAIARGHMPLHYSSSQADALRAGDELVNPLGNGNDNSIARGAKVFANYCAVCHGSDGAGMGPVAQRGFPPPPSLLLPPALQMKDGQVFHVLTYGQNNMPSYASQIAADDRWNVITYLRSIQSVAARNATATRDAATQTFSSAAAVGGKQ